MKRVDDKVYGDSLEQLVFGSRGIVRRFIKLSGDSMIEASLKQKDRMIVGKFNVFDAMRNFGKELIERLNEEDRAMVDRIAYFGISKNTFRFRSVKKEHLLRDLYNPTKQDNVLYPLLDSRRGRNYFFEFDYCYCIYRNVPTHYHFNIERVNETRSVVNGKWIVRPVVVGLCQ